MMHSDNNSSCHPSIHCGIVKIPRANSLNTRYIPPSVRRDSREGRIWYFHLKDVIRYDNCLVLFLHQTLAYISLRLYFTSPRNPCTILSSTVLLTAITRHRISLVFYTSPRTGHASTCRVDPSIKPNPPDDSAPPSPVPAHLFSGRQLTESRSRNATPCVAHHQSTTEIRSCLRCHCH